METDRYQEFFIITVMYNDNYWPDYFLFSNVCFLMTRSTVLFGSDSLGYSSVQREDSDHPSRS